MPKRISEKAKLEPFFDTAPGQEYGERVGEAQSRSPSPPAAAAEEEEDEETTPMDLDDGDGSEEE